VRTTSYKKKKKKKKGDGRKRIEEISAKKSKAN
jgi:hypothetical protein